MNREVVKIEATKKITKHKIKVAAYCRVSTDESSQLNSLSNQVSYYSELIQSNPDWEYAGCYIDKGISGTSTKHRDGFKNMLKACDAGKINIILCKSISRFARNTVDLLQAIRELKSKNIEVRFEKERISTFTKEGELMLSILASFAQNESYSISENVKWGLKKKRESGYIIKHQTYGYDIVNNAYTINQKEAKVVKFIFKLFLDGKNMAEISDALNELNIPSCHNLKWSRMIVKKILIQEKYAGYTLLQKYYTESPLTHKLVKNNGEKDMYKVDDHTIQIISNSDFGKTQEMLNAGNTRINRWKRRGEWYTGLIKCPVCGGTMVVRKGRGIIRCANHDKHHTCSNNQSFSFAEFIKTMNTKFTVLNSSIKDKIVKVVPKQCDNVTKFQIFLKK